MRVAIVAAILAYSSAAAGLTIDLGQFTLSHQQAAQINVFNPGPGFVKVRLVFSDGNGNTLIEHDETLQNGNGATLNLGSNSVPAGTQVRASVIALAAEQGTSCRPDATLQVITKGVSVSSITRGTVRQVPLNANEDAATHALRTIAKAQGLFYDGKRARGEAPSYAKSIEELEQAGILPKGYGRDLESATGYSFRFAVATLIYSAIAFRINPRSGDRAFFVDETGVIRVTDPCMDPPPANSGPLNN
jgi:hypothetical protein